MKMEQRLTIHVTVKLSLWSAIKLAIAGMRLNRNKVKITIQELIDNERGCKTA